MFLLLFGNNAFSGLLLQRAMISNSYAQMLVYICVSDLETALCERAGTRVRARTEEEPRGIGAAHHEFGQGGLQRASCLLTERRQCLHFCSVSSWEMYTQACPTSPSLFSRALSFSRCNCVSFLFPARCDQPRCCELNAVTLSFFTPFPEVSFLLYADSKET